MNVNSTTESLNLSHNHKNFAAYCTQPLAPLILGKSELTTHETKYTSFTKKEIF